MQEEQKVDTNIKEEPKKEKKIRIRVILVIIFTIIAGIFAYISYRGNYLETVEIGEKFKEVFITNLKYKYSIIGVNFIILFISITLAIRNINKGLKA